MGTVYLLHFREPVHGRMHYLGFTEKPLEVRLHEHRKGGVEASQLTRRARKLGITFALGNAWHNASIELEAKRKRERNLKRHCVECQLLALRDRAETIV